jgi:predicted MFS family arabinose efflux permease
LLVPAAALALAAAVSLGLSRFSYALLLPAMRADLGWSYFTAGAMNTANAAGYLAAALLAPAALRRMDARALMLAGGWAAAAQLVLHGGVRSDAALYGLRFLTGAASAASFVGGGVLAARLAGQAGQRANESSSAGLVLGIYYGGVGLGIITSAGLVPAFVTPQAVADGRGSGWAWAWVALGAAAVLFTALTAIGTRGMDAPPVSGAQRQPLALRPFAFGLAGYFMFGLGYIGYMTFIITMLREQGLAPALITAFYVVLGLGAVASSWLWAGLLQRHRNGRPMATLNALLAVATVLPVLSQHVVAVFASGLLFGAVFLSVVASTTALVRHNAVPAAWPAGIAAFTVVFAAGQIAGPSLVGWIADGSGGLRVGLAISALGLAVGALLASRQPPVHGQVSA